MKRNWTLFAAILVLLFAVVANRASARYKQGMADTYEPMAIACTFRGAANMLD